MIIIISGLSRLTPANWAFWLLSEIEKALRPLGHGVFGRRRLSQRGHRLAGRSFRLSNRRASRGDVSEVGQLGGVPARRPAAPSGCRQQCGVGDELRIDAHIERRRAGEKRVDPQVGQRATVIIREFNFETVWWS